eukprot:4112162-Pleurochrysis_carterae.AAC.3
MKVNVWACCRRKAFVQQQWRQRFDHDALRQSTGVTSVTTEWNGGEGEACRNAVTRVASLFAVLRICAHQRALGRGSFARACECGSNLKFTAKQLQRLSVKCAKDEKVEKGKIKKALEKDNHDGARIHAQAADARGAERVATHAARARDAALLDWQRGRRSQRRSDETGLWI